MALESEWLAKWAPGAHRAYLESNPSGGRLAVARRQAMAQQVQLRDVRPRAGQAWFPLVVDQRRLGPDGVQGILARVSVGGDGRALPDAQAEAVRRWVADWAGRPDTAGLERYALRVDHVPTEWTVTGGSLTFAAAVALISACLGQPVRGAWVLSGRVASNHAVMSVGHIDNKRAVCTLEAPDAQVFIADASESAERQLDALFGLGWRSRLSTALGVSARRLANEAWESYQQRKYDQAEAQAMAAQEGANDFAGAIARWVAGACRMHRGDPSARDLLASALAWFRTHPSRVRYQPEELTAYLAIALLDSGKPEAAVDLLNDSMAVLQAVPEGERYRRWQGVMVQVAGSLRRALVACDELDAAISVQRDWTLGATPDVEEERTRSLQDLAATLLQNGQRDEAVAALAQAREWLFDVAIPQRPFTERFLLLQEVRAGVTPPPYPVAPPDIRRQWPQPLEAFEALMANPTPDAFDAYVAAHWIPATLPRQELDIALAAAARATLRWGPRPWTAGLIRRLDQLASEGAPVSAALCRGAQALADGQAEILARIAAY